MGVIGAEISNDEVACYIASGVKSKSHPLQALVRRDLGHERGCYHVRHSEQVIGTDLMLRAIPKSNLLVSRKRTCAYQIARQ